jgi:hypothetical protein
LWRPVDLHGAEKLGKGRRQGGGHPQIIK